MALSLDNFLCCCKHSDVIVKHKHAFINCLGLSWYYLLQVLCMPASVQRLAMALQAQCPEILVIDNTVCLAVPNAFIKVDPDVGGEEKTTGMMAMCIPTVMQEMIQVCIAT